MLTEDDIKVTFLPFLKEFYKYRYEYRPDSVHTELDNVSAGGLVADGMVSFRKNDGSPFVCTYEATSADKAEEVKYSLNTVYFTWDCVAFGAVVAAVSYAIAYASRLAWLKSLQWSGNLGFIMGMGVIGFFSWYFLMRSWKKYRYIYAIEQFKQYFADEQWVAIAEDVFPAPTDPYLLELKNQCTYNGFGLAVVPEKGQIRVLATPSRLGMYGKDRRMAHWVTRLNWYQTMSHNVGTLSRFKPSMPDQVKVAWNKLWRPVHYLALDPLKKMLGRGTGRDGSVFNRFMQGQSVQKWVLTLSLTAIGALGFLVFRTQDDRVEELLTMPETNPEDQYGYLYEGPVTTARDPRAIPKQYPEPVKQETPAEEIPTINLSGDPEEEDIPTINLSGDAEGTPAPQTTPPQTETARTGPCDRFARQKGWIIQDSYFANKTFADERAAALRRKGIACELIPRICLGDDDREGYVVRLGATEATETAADAKSVQWTKTLERYGLLQGKLLVRRLN